jgi:hypothetical protein
MGPAHDLPPARDRLWGIGQEVVIALDQGRTRRATLARLSPAGALVVTTDSTDWEVPPNATVTYVQPPSTTVNPTSAPA